MAARPSRQTLLLQRLLDARRQAASPDASCHLMSWPSCPDWPCDLAHEVGRRTSFLSFNDPTKLGARRGLSPKKEAPAATSDGGKKSRLPRPGLPLGGKRRERQIVLLCSGKLWQQRVI
jgi:hypothetical protein